MPVNIDFDVVVGEWGPRKQLGKEGRSHSVGKLLASNSANMITDSEQELTVYYAYAGKACPTYLHRIRFPGRSTIHADDHEPTSRAFCSCMSFDVH
jgi:hypothetical protein